MKSGSLLLFLLIAFISKSAYSQSIFPPPPDEERLRVSAVKTEEKITIDGKLDESAWKKCRVLNHFIENYPIQRKTPAYDTQVRVLYDDNYLYIGAICFHPNAKTDLVVKDLRRDAKYNENELFCVIIEPYLNERMPTYSFWVNPYGAQTDQLIYDDLIYDYDWDGVWKVKCTVEDSCWIAEFAIPFSTLRYPANSTEWSVNFNRNIRSLGEVTSWSPYPIAYDAGKIAYGGLITDLHPPVPKVSLKINPYTLLNYSENSGEKKSAKPQAGTDIKWALGTDTYFDLTVNTDFAQADVDKQIVNLSRSSLFLPEKRQFFLENARLFSLGKDEIFQPFFSRRIGLSENGESLPINFGVRFIQQNVDQSIGALVIKQGEKGNSAGAAFGLIRYQKNLSESFRIGSMFGLKYGEPLNGVGASLNTVGVVDASVQISEPFFIRSMFSYSYDRTTKRNGVAFLSELNYTDNVYNLNWLESIVGDGFTTDLGFLARENFIYSNPSLTVNFYYDWLPKSIVYFNPTISAAIFHSASTGKFEEAQLTITPISFYFVNTSKLTLSIIPSWETLNNEFEPVSGLPIAQGKYQYVRYEVAANSNSSAPVSGQVDLSTGGYYNGSLNSYFMSIRLAPSPFAAVAVGYTRNDFSDVGITGGKKTTHLIAPELRIALNPSLQLTSFYQYNTDSNKGALNIRLSWEYQPLSFIYFIFNSIKNIDLNKPIYSADQQNAIFKISYYGQL